MSDNLKLIKSVLESNIALIDELQKLNQKVEHNGEKIEELTELIKSTQAVEYDIEIPFTKEENNSWAKEILEASDSVNVGGNISGWWDKKENEVVDDDPIRPSSGDMTPMELATEMNLFSINDIPHSKLVSAIAQEAGIEIKKDPEGYMNEYVKLPKHTGSENQIHFTPTGAKYIKEWFEEYGDHYYFQEKFKKSSKYGNNGDVREEGYEFEDKKYYTYIASVNGERAYL